MDKDKSVRMEIRRPYLTKKENSDKESKNKSKVNGAISNQKVKKEDTKNISTKMEVDGNDSECMIISDDENSVKNGNGIKEQEDVGMKEEEDTQSISSSASSSSIVYSGAKRSTGKKHRVIRSEDEKKDDDDDVQSISSTASSLSIAHSRPKRLTKRKHLVLKSEDEKEEDTRSISSTSTASSIPISHSRPKRSTTRKHLVIKSEDEAEDKRKNIKPRRSTRVVKKKVSDLESDYYDNSNGNGDEVEEEEEEGLHSRSLRTVKKTKYIFDIDFNDEQASSSFDETDYEKTTKKKSNNKKKAKNIPVPVESHLEACEICKDGGELLCCDSCPLVYHPHCLNPPLKGIPDGDWRCPRCSCEPLDGKMRQILTWRYAADETIEYRNKFFSVPLAQRKLMPKPRREFFIALEGKSYWHCVWVTPEQLLATEPLYNRHLFKARFNKYDDQPEPPPDFDYETICEDDFTDEDDKKSSKSSSIDKKNSLYERFYKNGVKPEWLQIQRIFNHRVQETGTGIEYFVKWRDVGYDLATWETEETCSDPLLLPEFKKHVEIYKEFRNCFLGNYKANDAQFVYKHIMPPPPKPTTILKRSKYTYNDRKLPFLRDDNLELMDYQIDGLNFLRHSYANHTDTILADEMGLGKTIQAIMFMYSLYKEGHSKGPFLVTAPLSTVVNWEREFEKWAKDFYVVTYTGIKECRAVLREYELTYDKKAAKALAAAQNRKLKGKVKFHVLLTSYEYVWKDSTCLQSIDWEMIIVDEGHRLKTGASIFFTSLQSYKTEYKLILTGTPLQNNLEELYYLLNFLVPTKFNQLDPFLNEFAEVTKEEQVKKLHDMLGPHMLRRLKADVLKNLPKKSEVIVRVELSPMQKTYYKAILERNFDVLNSKMGGKQTSLMFIMMDLKKICNHPYLFSSAAMTAKVSLEHTQDERYELESLIKASGKLILLEKMLKKLKEQGHRVLIFCQMTRMMDILEDFMVGLGHTYERIDGSIRGSDRQEAIDRFNSEGSKSFVFLLSTKAGGLGINLATADTIIIYDSDWNPHNDLQALSRAHRIGQKNKVMVYRFVTRKSIEERIMQVAKKKLLLNQLVVETNRGTGNKDKLSFTKQELETIVRWGSEDLFKDGEGNATIHYTDAMIDDLLDREKEGSAPQKDHWVNDLLSSFKVATFETTTTTNGEEEAALKLVDGEEDVEKQAENLNDPNFWQKVMKKNPDDPNATTTTSHDPNALFKNDLGDNSDLGRGKRKSKYRGTYFDFSDPTTTTTPDVTKKPKVVKAKPPLKPTSMYSTTQNFKAHAANVMKTIPSLTNPPSKYPNYMLPLNIPIPMGWHPTNSNNTEPNNRIGKENNTSKSTTTTTIQIDSDSDINRDED